MKKHYKILLAATLAVVCAVAVLVYMVSGVKITAVAAAQTTEASADDSQWTVVTDGSVCLENESLLLQLDCRTTHFTVTHKASGKSYASVPSQAADADSAELLIRYYDSNSAEATMNSYENSVLNPSYEVRTDGKTTVRVNYTIQKSKQRLFVPSVISRDTFENQVLGNLDAGPQRRLKVFYTLYESAANDADTKAMKKQYPALKKQDLYVLRESVRQASYTEITDYMTDAGYSEEAYAQEAERLELGDSALENQSPGFVVPVEYTLTASGFSARILTDRIVSHAAGYTLTDVSLLPYFGSGQSQEKGWFLVPDGSGAIISWNEKKGSTYAQSIWGTDMAVEASHTATLTQNACLPVFASHDGEKAFFAEISGLPAGAAVQAEVAGDKTAYSRIYAAFRIRDFDSSNAGALMSIASFNIYSATYVSELPQVTYTLFPQAETTYSDMANRYREKLVQEGTLGERLSPQEAVPLYMDFTGYETVDSSFFGIPTKSTAVLSTLTEVDETVQQLHAAGIDNLQVRLKAYAHAGIYHSLADGFSLHSRVGSVKELNALAQRLSAGGGYLYLDNPISTVYTTGSGFRKMTHATRGLKKTVLQGFDYDLVARSSDEAADRFYMISPAFFASLTGNYIDTFNKKMSEAANIGYSWSDYGSKLFSDFNAKHPYDRSQTVAAMDRAATLATDAFGRLITDGGNAYVLGKATALLNVPLGNSALDCESYAVPFYAMVLHGYVDYAGAPMNTGANMDRAYLAGIESGASPYYSCYTAENAVLKKTAAGTLIYPTAVQASLETIKERYAEFNSLFRSLRSQTIVAHERVADNVFVTTYEKGTKIAVNYGSTASEVGGVEVPAGGYAVLEGGR